MQTRPIHIVCPEYRKIVRGKYLCGEQGEYLLGPGGRFLLERCECGQLGGRCAQTLCALHRYNRRGRNTWYPLDIFAARSPSKRKRPETTSPTAPRDKVGLTDTRA